MSTTTPEVGDEVIAKVPFKGMVSGQLASKGESYEIYVPKWENTVDVAPGEVFRNGYAIEEL